MVEREIDVNGEERETKSLRFGIQRLSSAVITCLKTLVALFFAF